MTRGDRSRPLRQRWEARAARYGNSLQGVLYQGLPPNLNELLHTWHAQVIVRHLLPRLPEDALVADLASGYGRLSRVIHDLRPDVRLIGIDSSPRYTRQYQHSGVGQGLCADLQALPCRASTWHAALLVTGLMYLPAGRRPSVIEAVQHGTKPGGVVLFLDPGAEAIWLARRLQPDTGRRTTGGEGFGQEDYARLLVRPGWQAVAEGGNQYFTLNLPLLLLLHRHPRLVQGWGQAIVEADLRSRHDAPLQRLALHRWILVERRVSKV